MRFKLDENLGGRCTRMFTRAGHEVSTVFQQGLAKAPDNLVIDACQREGLCLVTLDLDFGNPLLFRPSEYHSIAVLRLPPRAAPDDLSTLVETLLAGLRTESIVGKLWTVQLGRIRQYQEERAEQRPTGIQVY